MIKFKKMILRLLPSILSAGSFLALFMQLLNSQMVPVKYLVLYLLGAVILTCLVVFLTYVLHKKHFFVIGTLVTVIIILICWTAGSFLNRTIETIRSVSNTSTKRTNISFYVGNDNPIQTLDQAADLTFGILNGSDETSVNETIAQTTQNMGFTPKTRSYESLISLADGFHAGEVDGILIGDAYLSLYEDIVGYETFPSELKTLSTSTIEQSVDKKEKEDDGSSILNILISGSDTRSAVIDENGRSDVNIIVSINTETHEILLLSTPRDYFVALDIDTPNAYDKLTHAGIYGMDVLTGTLGKLYGINIDYFFRLNFTGFVDIIDALGGVDVTSVYEFDSGQYHFEAGVNHLDGEAALAFAHNRYAFSSGDRQRGYNEMAILKAALKKAMTPAILTTYSTILDSVQSCIYTNIPYDVLAELVRQQLEDPQTWTISNFSVDGSDATSTTYSINQQLYVMIPYMTKIQQAQRMLEEIGNTVESSEGAYQGER